MGVMGMGGFQWRFTDGEKEILQGAAHAARGHDCLHTN